MSKEAAATIVQASGLNILKDPARPGVTLVRMCGKGHDGHPIVWEVERETLTLAWQLFGDLFKAALDKLLEVADANASERSMEPPHLPELELLAGLAACENAKLAHLIELAIFVRALGEVWSRSYAKSVREAADAALRLALDPPAPAQAETDRAAPPHAGTTSLEDRVSNSIGAAPGEDRSLLEGCGPGAVTA